MLRVLGMVYWGDLGIEFGVVILFTLEWCIWLLEGVRSTSTIGSLYLFEEILSIKFIIMTSLQKISGPWLLAPFILNHSYALSTRWYIILNGNSQPHCFNPVQLHIPSYSYAPFLIIQLGIQPP